MFDCLLQLPLVVKPVAPLSIILTTGGGGGGLVAVPASARSNEPFASSLLRIESEPPNEPAAPAWNRIVNVVDWPVASEVEPRSETSVKPAGMVVPASAVRL